MRRLQLSKEDAINLFPEVQSTVEAVFRINMKQRDMSGPFKASLPVFIYDNEGRQWPLVLECLLTAGQRHVRLVKGWAEMCIAKGYSVGKTVRLVRLEQALLVARVTVSIV